MQYTVVLELSLACRAYEITRPLMEGRVKLEGVSLNYVPIDFPAETFRRMLKHEDFHASELSLANYLEVNESERGKFTAIPIFPSRSFRHSYIFVNKSSGIVKPEQLAGKSVGIFPGYFITAAVWMRGILKDEYDVRPSQMRWFAAKEERVNRSPPKDVELQVIPPGESIFDLLIQGRVDALISPLIPQTLLENPNVSRLFEDYLAKEQEYFRRTGIFPIMHTVAIRGKVLEENPWVAASLAKGFQASKQLYYEDRDESIGDLHAFPWIRAQYESDRKIFGKDPYPYGLKANRKTLQTFISYAIDQGAVSSHVEPEQLFAENTVDSYYMKY